MNAPGIAIVTAARAAVGSRFRLHGRDPRFGLDCVGLVAVALRAGGCGGAVPEGYALRGGSTERFVDLIEAAGLLRVDAVGSEAEPGDLLLFQAGPEQFHLGIAVPGGVVHADAGLRRVVERPGTVPWPVLGMWRVLPRSDGGTPVGPGVTKDRAGDTHGDLSPYRGRRGDRRAGRRVDRRCDRRRDRP